MITNTNGYFFTYCKIISDATTNDDKSDDMSTIKEKDNSAEDVDELEMTSNDKIAESQDQAPDENFKSIMSSNENNNSPEKQKLSEKNQVKNSLNPKSAICRTWKSALQERNRILAAIQQRKALQNRRVQKSKKMNLNN